MPMKSGLKEFQNFSKILKLTTLVSGTIKFRYRTIDFPNLGIHLKSVGDHITVFGFDIAYYGIVIGIGILAGLMMAVLLYTAV